MTTTTAQSVKAMLAGLQRCGLSLTEIAEQSGVSRATVHRGVNGQALAPSHDTFTRLSSLAERVGPPPAIGKIVRR